MALSSQADIQLPGKQAHCAKSVQRKYGKDCFNEDNPWMQILAYLSMLLSQQTSTIQLG